MSGSASFDSAPELPDHVEDALADALLRAPAERKRRLEELIEQHRDLEPALCARIAGTAPAGPGDGARIGRYQLQQKIAEGGMGSVWMAQQREPIKRRVAVKVIKLGMDTVQVMARFEAERQALAMMEHPNIAKVLDAGSTEIGRPYFVMEYIEGTPILEHCNRQKVDTAGRLRLFLKVCNAIQHAHQKGVIHRDIKPSNVLVALHDAVPVPKVIDFGVAKATGSELTERTLFTQHRQMIGTPAYMSPEQISGSDIDTRSDIYALGVLLYELLTGTTPFDNTELVTKGVVEMVRTIREDDPPKPSTRISTLGDEALQVASMQRSDAARLGTKLRGDLDWIVMKCLEKNRTRRYETANELAADVQRHLDTQPVLARPPSAGYRLRKFVRRNRGQVLAGAIVATTLVLGLVVSGMGWRWALDERAQAEVLVRFLDDTLQGIGPSVAKGRDITMLKEMMDAAGQRIEQGELAAAPQAEARLRGTIGGIYRDLAQYDEAQAMLEPALQLAHSCFSNEHEQVARAMSNLAILHYVRGNLSDAERLSREALRINQLLFPGDDRRVASAQGNLAMLLQARGEHAQAERLYRASLAMNRRLFAGDHRSIAWGLQALATLLSAQGDTLAAEPLYFESLAMNRRLLPGDGPRVATGLGHLGILLHGRGEFDRAEQYYRESLAMNQRLFPHDHPNVATGLNALAMLLEGRGEVAEATKLFVESMEMSRRLFAEDDPNGAVDLDALASLYWSQQQFDKSIPLFEQALTARQAKLGGQHLDTLTTVAKLGVNYHQAGRLTDALPLLEEAVAASFEQPTLAIARPALLDIYATIGSKIPFRELDEAVRLVRQLHQAVPSQFPEHSFDRAEREFCCGAALLGLQQWNAAESMLLAGFRGMSERTAGGPPDSLQRMHDALQGVVTTYELAGRSHDAAAWQQRRQR
tara:strand:+ start:52998 stop:55784 length:2787 start_codon:yes stop_codon:yes gene_type:complete